MNIRATVPQNLTRAEPVRRSMVTFENISKRFDQKTQSTLAVDAVDLTISRGEFVAFVGPSGCGKTTLLNLAAGLLKPDQGEVWYDGLPLNAVNTNVGYLTQTDALLPWRSVLANVTLPLEIRRVPAAERRQRAFAILDRVGLTSDPITQDLIRKTHALCFQYFDRKGIDPFKERYPITFVLEGTMRAGGGIAIDDNLQTRIAGLFAGGDVTSREKLVGAGPPGGGPASAWAFATGHLAGRSAAKFARSIGGHAATRKVTSAAQVGGGPVSKRDISPDEIIKAVQEEILPLEKNYWRTGTGMSHSLAKFNALWRDVMPGYGHLLQNDRKATARERMRTREAAALLAAGRWIYASANDRTESRGLHRRKDFTEQDPAQDGQHIISGGLNEVWLRRSAHVNTLTQSQGVVH